MSENNTTGTGYEVGSTFVFNIPPGWILGGTIQESTKDEIVVKDAVYIEGIADGHSALGSVPSANTPKELKAIVTRSYPSRDGMRFRRDAVLISVPCARDLTPLSRAEDASAIKKAAGK
jgi:hypothetical protein